MSTTPNLGIEVELSGHVPLQNTVERIANALDENVGIGTAIVSSGTAITIPVGSTMAEALKILADAIDPGV